MTETYDIVRAALVDRRREDHRQRIHAVPDVVAALRGSGLQLLAVPDFDNPAGPVDDADRVIFLAERP